MKKLLSVIILSLFCCCLYSQEYQIITYKAGAEHHQIVNSEIHDICVTVDNSNQYCIYSNTKQAIIYVFEFDRSYRDDTYDEGMVYLKEDIREGYVYETETYIAIHLKVNEQGESDTIISLQKLQ